MRIGLFVYSVTCLIVSSPTVHAFDLSGDVENDFTDARVWIVGDETGGIGDVAGHHSITSPPGWDMKDVRFYYEPDTDELVVGINFVGICGDADGNGDPDRASSSSEVPDSALLGMGESVNVRFDFDRDGRFDAIAGVPLESDLNSPLVARPKDPTDHSAAAVFGAPFPNAISIHAPPERRGLFGLLSSPVPDLEFVIDDFSELSSCRTENFFIYAFAGGPDDLVGEDNLMGTAWGLGAIPFEDAYATGTSFRVWAPFAKEVEVRGLGGQLDAPGTALVQEPMSGVWSARLPRNHAGEEFRYRIVDANDNILWKQDARSLQIVNTASNSILYEPRSFTWGEGEGSESLDPWNKWVIYELHVGTFLGTTDTPGTFTNLITRLDYLEGLGVNAIELLPVNSFMGTDDKKRSGGYDASHPYAMEETYGTPDTFKKLVRACHEHDIAVVADVVYNHWGPPEMDLWQYDGWSENGFGGIYFYQDNRLESGFGSRPDYGRGEVRDYIYDNLAMWLCEYHIDGFRWDSVVNIRSNNNSNGQFGIPDGRKLVREGNDYIDAVKPGAISIAEDLQGSDSITGTTADEGYGFDSQWGSGFYWSLYRVLTNTEDGGRNVQALANSIAQRDHNDAFRRILYSENHDEVWELNNKVRLPDRIDASNPGSWYARKRSTMGAAIVMTAPGIPMLFMGQERYATNVWNDQEPMEWAMNETQQKIHLLYKDLIALRRNLMGSTKGLSGQSVNMYHVNNSDKVLGFHRWDQGGDLDDTVVIANFSNNSFADYAIGFPRGGRWSVRFNSDSAYYGSDYGNFGSSEVFTTPQGLHGLNHQASVAIAPYSVLLLSQGNPESRRRREGTSSPFNILQFGEDAATGQMRIVVEGHVDLGDEERIGISNSGLYDDDFPIVTSEYDAEMYCTLIQTSVPWQGLPNGYNRSGATTLPIPATIWLWRDTR